MCLVTTNKDGLISDKPVMCYKLYGKDEADNFISPFQGTCYHLKEGDEVIAEESEKIEESCGYYGLGPGFIHATTERWMPFFVCTLDRDVLLELLEENVDEQHVDEVLERVMSYLTRYHRFCEMEIPAGERYWVEVDMELPQKGICSHKMIFRREYKIGGKSDLMGLIYNAYLSESTDRSKQERWKQLIEKYKAKGE